jgi:hypothetical protein
VLVGGPGGGTRPDHQLANEVAASGHTARNVARRIRIACMTSLDQRPTMMFVTVAKPPRTPRRSAMTDGRYRRLAEAPDRFLEIRKARPVLDVEQCPTRQIPREYVRPPRELEVLIGLVDRHREAVVRHPRRDHLAHRGVNRVLRSDIRGPSARVDQVQVRFETESARDGCVRRKARDRPVLDRVDHRRRYGGPIGQFAERPMPAAARVANHDAGVGRHAMGKLVRRCPC